MPFETERYGEPYLAGRYPPSAIIGVRLLDSTLDVRFVKLFAKDVHALLNVKSTEEEVC